MLRSSNVVKEKNGKLELTNGDGFIFNQRSSRGKQKRRQVAIVSWPRMSLKHANDVRNP